jgi:tRNA A-37 threonylcarbamoyl transferase component Bud32
MPGGVAGLCTVPFVIGPQEAFLLALKSVEMAATEEHPTLAMRSPPPDEFGGPLVLGRYRLGERLGQGGFGAVHAAVDERLDREVAVKVIQADGRADDRVRREARAAARLDHPGIVAIHDAGEEPGARYLVSELVRGRTLAALEADGALSDRDVVRIGLALCDALEHAHERGVVHRDIKPHNVIIPERGREPAKLTDFGIAHLIGDEPLTMTGDVVGTLAYMAPEQANGTRVDERADLYSLALTIYEALAGVHPVKAGTPAATANRIGKALPPLSKHRKDLPAELSEAIDRALRPRPDERGDLDDLADALADALGEVSDEGGTVVVAPHPLEDALPPRWGRPAAALGAGVLAGAAVWEFAGDGSVGPLPVAGAVAALVLALPRLGWLIGALGALVVVGLEHPGSATVLAAALAPVPLLVRRTPTAWSLPGAAPLLGLLSLAGAYPALAGRARHWAARLGLGATGAWLLLLAEPLLDRRLLLGTPAGVPVRDRFDDGASLAAADVIGPLTAAPTIALVAIWAGAALLLPWIVRGRTLAGDLVGATAWTAGLAAATASLSTSGPRGLVLGAVAAGAVAVWRR